jgi:hypothetical protein
MSLVKCTAEFRPGEEPLVKDQALEKFITSLPNGTVLHPVMVEKGGQRDPWKVMVGIRAAWDEER